MRRYKEEGGKAESHCANSGEPEFAGSRWFVSKTFQSSLLVVYRHRMTLELIFSDKPPENSDGLDRKFTLNYYSRMRFITNLLPLLRTASTTGPHLSRTLSVLGPGNEGKLNFDDLDLKNTFSTGRCADHSIVMNDFMTEELASRETGTAFVHSSPFLVVTGAARELPLWARIGVKVLTPVLGLFAVGEEETGARQLFLATSGLYPPAKPTAGSATAAGMPVPKGLAVVKGMDGKVGSGGYTLNYDGEIAGKKSLLDEYHSKGVGKTVWEHTMGIFEKLEKTEQAKPNVK
jgi:hypothetical protein